LLALTPVDDRLAGAIVEWKTDVVLQAVERSAGKVPPSVRNRARSLLTAGRTMEATYRAITVSVVPRRPSNPGRSLWAATWSWLRNMWKAMLTSARLGG
jgi:hypothetical protein